MYAGFSYYANVAPAYILLGQLPFVICGGYINFVSAAYSYISDISSEENRALRFVFILYSVSSKIYFHCKYLIVHSLLKLKSEGYKEFLLVLYYIAFSTF